MSMRQVNAILHQQSFIDRGVSPVTSQSEGTHVGNHQGQHETIAAGHLEDDEDGGHGGANDSSKDRTHPDHGKGSDGVGRVVEDGDIKIANRTAQHCSHEERWSKDAACTTA